MPTPVRVRGKKGNKKLVLERLKGKQTVGKAFEISKPMPQQRMQSRLEQLPNELLQDIFLLSRNFDLPLVSHGLNARLSSERIKKEFVICTFSAGHVVSRSFNYTKNDIGEDFNDYPRWFSRQDDCRLKRPGQFDLARRKWFNFEFFQQCQNDYFLREIRKLIAQYKQHCSADAQREAFESFNNWFQNKPSKSISSEWEEFQVPRNREPLLLHLVMIRDAFGVCSAMSHYFTLAHFPQSINKSWITEPLHLRMPAISPDFILPNKLLRGPWDYSTLHLLYHILDAAGYFSSAYDPGDFQLQFDPDIASSGLSYAIHQYSAPAIVLLAKPSFRGTDITFNQGELPFLDMGERFPPFGRSLDSEIFDLTRGLEVVITEHHLVAALEAAIAHNDVEARVFCWLYAVQSLQARESRHDQELLSIPQRVEEIKLDENSRGIKQGTGANALFFCEQWQKTYPRWPYR